MAFRGTYAPLNPQPVTINDGQFIGISNLGTIEDSLAAIEVSTEASSGAITAAVSGESTLSTKDLSITELMKELLVVGRIIKQHLDLITGENLTEQDIGD